MNETCLGVARFKPSDLVTPRAISNATMHIIAVPHSFPLLLTCYHSRLVAEEDGQHWPVEGGKSRRLDLIRWLHRPGVTIGNTEEEVT